MMTLKEIILHLNEKGFKHEYNQLLSGILTNIEMKDSLNRFIHLEVHPTNEFLDSLKEDEEYEIDYDNFELVGATFESIVSYPEGKKDICLYKDTLEYFWTAFEIFQDPISWAIKTMKSHITNMEYFNNYIKPILLKYDFYPDYDSFWDTEEKDNIGSSPMFSYKYKYYDISISFYTDLLTQEFMWLEGKVDKDTFEEQFIAYLKEESELCFERFFTDDKTFTPTSFRDVLNLVRCIKWKRKANRVNFDNIPNSYKYLIKEYNELGL